VAVYCKSVNCKPLIFGFVMDFFVSLQLISTVEKISTDVVRRAVRLQSAVAELLAVNR